MAPTTANSLLLSTISLQNVNAKLLHIRNFILLSMFVFVWVREKQTRDRDKRVCTFGQLGQYWVCEAVLLEIEKQ